MEYEVSLQTIAWINSQRNEEALEISAAFQRRAVWLERERSELIATVLLGLPFPEIYIHVVTDADSGKQRHVVVDGQQRTTSIIKFIDNEFALPASHSLSGSYFKDLPAEVKEKFWDYKIVVRSLRKTNEAEIRDIFARLNTNNIILNDQELRNARYAGRFKQAAERLADNPLFEEMNLFTARDMRRMLDVEFVSELLLRLVAGITNKKDLLEEVYAANEEEFPNESSYEAEFTTAMALIWSIYDESNKVIFKSRGNFSSLFGCFVEYYRKTGRRTFQNPERVKGILTEFLAAVRERAFTDEQPKIEEYQDAVARASSDRVRRYRREQIIGDLLIEAGEIENKLFS
ncbi:hypothetical protein CXK91_16340 [Stutzerimonas stutzeri]|uniref:GmrSD restriction endonucleases N-terminal domain-containing protein n=1 Tax=Stutzerimonas stutzeri TaxID=316 RepID=A0A2S4AL84_STUST|nr:DUF262 domain-containing protein [Stutzerimonas stutzeri]MCQ4263952.1 DUF262 domain-containing protein [Stutzerimonas stutzeri]POH82149.1 hypothetical protein CXK91_16340 [Stutzerimonas stutzeri]